MTRALKVFTAAMLIALSACADKGFTPPRSSLSPTVSLQITVASQQQATLGPRWLIVAAGYDGEDDDGGGDDGGVLGYRNVPYTSGTQTVRLSVDISRCLAAAASRGRASCPMLVGAVLKADSLVVADSSGDDLFADVFDSFVAGPFDVVPGRTPVIPPFDLSASRFGVIKWQGDEALQLGGVEGAPVQPFGPVFGVPRGAGEVALFVPTQGGVFSTAPNQGPQGPYPQLAVFESGRWRRHTATNLAAGSAPFTAVAALAMDEAYAAHRSGLHRFNGSAFAPVATINDSLFSASAVTTAGSAKYVIAGGGAGVVWIGNTQTWTRHTLGTTQRIDGVCITGPNEAFAASTFGGGLWRFNGTAWTSVPAPTPNQKFGLQCPSPGVAYVQASGGFLLRWNGTGWVSVPTTGLSVNRLISWGVVSPTEAYAWGDSASVDRAFYRFDGTTWTEVGRKRFALGVQLVNSVMWADPRGGAAYIATSFGRVERVTPSSVSVLSYQPSLRDVAVTSPASAFAVGHNMFLGRWDGAKWTVDAPPAGGSATRTLQGVWSGGPANAWAVGSANTLLHYDGIAWRSVSGPTTPVAVPDNYNAVWGSGSTVWIVGDNTMVRCTAPTACANETSGAGALYSVWGSGPGGSIFAVGANGRIIRSVGGGTWQPMTSPTNRTLARVSGSGPNDVWAVGDSVLIRFDGTQWSSVPLTGDLQFFKSRVVVQPQGNFQLGLWARGPTEVYLGADNGGLARWDGREWLEMRYVNFRRRIVGISGGVGGCALAVGEGISDLPTPTLWRGLGPSGCFASAMAPPTSWP